MAHEKECVRNEKRETMTQLLGEDRTISSGQIVEWRQKI
jgi:hypothetical protein